jgi:c-di-GMP-binding flagellar brake protein YcgR
MDFAAGDLLELEMIDGDFKEVVSCQIIATFNEQLYITLLNIQSLPPFPDGALVRVSFCKKDDALYEFETQLWKVPEEQFSGLSQRLRYYRIVLPKNTNRKQRRSYVRISVRIPVEFLYFYRKGIPVTASTAYSIDLSAGGVRVETNDDFPLKAHYKIGLYLPNGTDYELLYLNVEVVRCKQLTKSEHEPLIYEIALEYRRISEMNMKKILKFVYKQQELRSKSLI